MLGYVDWSLWTTYPLTYLRIPPLIYGHVYIASQSTYRGLISCRSRAWQIHRCMAFGWFATKKINHEGFRYICMIGKAAPHKLFHGTSNYLVLIIGDHFFVSLAVVIFKIVPIWQLDILLVSLNYLT